MIHVGFAETDITPRLGSQSPGGMQARRLIEVHDPLKAVAMVIKGEKATVALVGIDALFITEETTARVREAIARETHIPGANVLIGASHTHGGGPIASCFESDADAPYLELVAARVAEAVGLGLSAHCMRPSRRRDRPGAEHQLQPTVPDVRRQAGHAPGKGNANIVKPAGPIDPDVGVLAARSSDGEILGLFVNFACHLTVMGGNGFTADYVYHLRETLRKHYKKPQLPVGFLLGAGGMSRRLTTFGRAVNSVMNGRGCSVLALAAETCRPIERMTWRKDASLGPFRRSWTSRSAMQVRTRRQTPALGLGSGSSVEKIYARERELVAQERAKRAVIPCEVQAIRVGELGIVTNGRVLLPARPRHQGCESVHSNVGGQPGQRLDRLCADTVGVLCGRLRARTARARKMAPWAGQSLVEASLAAIQGIRLAEEGARTNS